MSGWQVAGDRPPRIVTADRGGCQYTEEIAARPRRKARRKKAGAAALSGRTSERNGGAARKSPENPGLPAAPQ